MRTLSWWFPFLTKRGFVFNYTLGAFYGGITGFGMIWQIIKDPKNFFASIPRREPPKCLTQEKYGRHNYVNCGNIKLHYVSNGDPNKPLMLFLHGFPETWYSWRHQIPEFSKDYFTVALNMRGYAHSDKPRGVENYSLDKLVEDVKLFMQSLGKEKCILIAHDWGGVVAWAFTAQYPQMVDRFIVCNAPNLKYWKQAIETDWKQFKQSSYVFLFNIPFLPELRIKSFDYKMFEIMFKKFGTKEDIDSYKYYFSKPYGLSGPINYYRALQRGFAKDFALSLENKRIITPTLIIWGKNDTALTSHLPYDCSESCDDCTIKMIDQCSHWTQLDKPDLVNKYIKEFLEKN